MEYTIGLIALINIVYFFLNGRAKKGVLKKFENWCTKSFKIHCQKVLNSDYKYSLKSVAVILGIIFGILFLFSLILQTITSENHPVIEAIISEMAIIFFIVFLGAKTKEKLLFEIKYALIDSFKPIRKFIIGANAFLFIFYIWEEMTLKEIVMVNGVMILAFGVIFITMFLYLKAIPFIGYHGATIVYRKIIKQSYLHHANPLSYFFGYFSALLFVIHGIHWLIMLYILA